MIFLRDVLELPLWNLDKKSVEGKGKNEDMNKLFQPFQRIGMSLTKSYTEGTGIGLYLTKKLTDFLGGDISVKSEYGRGSELTFSIPLRYEYGDRNAKYSLSF